MDLSILIPARRAEHCIADTVRRIRREMARHRARGSYEIVVLSNLRPGDEDPTPRIARRLAARYDEVQALTVRNSPGKGAALKWGVRRARGRVIAFIDADLPFEPEFLERAARRVERGAELVVANRRLSTRDGRGIRPWLGLAFNRLVRLLLPIRATDTQAGAKVMSRRLAQAAFRRVQCPGFLFDLELFLCAAGAVVDLDVTARPDPGRSTVSVARQALPVLYWLLRIVWSSRRGHYDRSLEGARSLAAVTADDWGLSRGVNEGILRLAREGVVTRVSILVDAAHAAYRLHELAAIPGVELGLHLNLTHGAFSDGRLLRHSGPAGFLARWCLAGRRGRRVVHAEAVRQLARLAGLGVEIRYVDSHHHVHLIPGVVDAIAPALRAAGIVELRLPLDRSLRATRKLPILLLALAARPAWRRNGFSYLPCFYPRALHYRNRARLAADLDRVCARHGRVEVIAHPAAFDDLGTIDWPDPYRAERVREFEALLDVGRRSTA